MVCRDPFIFDSRQKATFQNEILDLVSYNSLAQQELCPVFSSQKHSTLLYVQHEHEHPRQGSTSIQVSTSNNHKNLKSSSILKRFQISTFYFKEHSPKRKF